MKNTPQDPQSIEKETQNPVYCGRGLCYSANVSRLICQSFASTFLAYRIFERVWSYVFRILHTPLTSFSSVISQWFSSSADTVPRTVSTFLDLL